MQERSPWQVYTARRISEQRSCRIMERRLSNAAIQAREPV